MPSSQRIALSLSALVLGACSSTPVVELPAGYELVYSQDFEGPSWTTDFAVTDPAVWVPGRLEDNGTLLHTGPGRYLPPHGGPTDFALLGGVTVGDFVLDFDVLLTGEVTELSIFFGVEGPDRFVYASLAPRASDTRHDVFRVDNALPLAISTRRTFGLELTPNVWHHVRVQRDDLVGRLIVAVGEPPLLEMEARNGALAPGWLGFGVNGGAVHFDHLRLYAPSYEIRSLEYLPTAGQSRR